MPNHLAIAAATEALRQRIQAAVQVPVSGAQAVAKRPEAADSQAKPTVWVYLYRISPNAALRNADLPTRDAQGRTVRRPVAALDLHYLLSFTGNEEESEPQRMLGLTVAALHAEPALDRTSLAPSPTGPTWLQSSDLAEQSEAVKFAPSQLSLDDLSKLWSVFFQIPYQLSTGYEASLVLLEAEATLRRSLPVRDQGVAALSARRAVLASVNNGDPVVGGPALRIALTGRNLRGPATYVALDGGDGVPVTPAGNTLLVLPAAEAAALGAGVHRVQVVHEVPLGNPPVPHRAVESNVLPFVLRPAISVTLSGTDVEVGLVPPVRPAQRVRLLLDEVTDPPPPGRDLRSVTLEASDDGSPGPWDSMTFDASGVGAGDYLVRVQVDGAESLTSVDGNGRPAPRVVLP